MNNEFECYCQKCGKKMNYIKECDYYNRKTGVVEVRYFKCPANSIHHDSYYMDSFGIISEADLWI